MNQTKKAVYRYRWAILASVWLAFTVFWIQRLSIPPLAPFLLNDLNLTHAQIGLLMTATATGALIVQLPAGWLVDRIGVRIPLLIGQVLGGISLLGMSRVNSITSALAVMSLVGIWVGFLSPATTKAVINWFPVNERAMVMGLKQTGVNMGGIITAVTLPTLALTAGGWRLSFLIVGLMAVAFGIITFAIYKETPEHSRYHPTTPATAVTGRVVREIFLNRDILSLSFAVFCISLVEFAAITYLVIYLEEVVLLSVVTAGFLLAVCQFGGAIGKPLSGLISDRLFGGRRKKPFIIMNLTAGVCCVLVIWTAALPSWALVLLFVVLGLTAIGWGGLYLTLVGEFVGTERAGIGTGFSLIITGWGPLLGPALFGYIVDLSGSYQPAWLFLSICAALSALLLLLIREERKKLT